MHKIFVMIPSAENSDYPKFVADQVLTSDNLNDLFGYLDEQERMTRTNLVGMGIVCGLKVITAADGSSIKITKGVGVTSSGYLVAVPDITYTKRTSNVFDAVKCAYYDRFVDISSKTQRFDLWELKQDAEAEGTTGLTSTFLNDGKKIVLIFVELLEENNKNCDPDSCDDKGTKVTVNFRPLLVSKANADAFLSNSSNNTVTNNAVLLTETKMPRYDVASTLLLDSEDVFEAYQKILTPAFIGSVKSVLSNAYTKLNSLLADDFPTDPFSTINSQFAFLNNGTISPGQAINLQYYYDFFADLLLGYDELRKKAFDVLCECLPDESLFPRHLLLGEAIGFDEMNSLYRTRFISSPVLCCCADDANAVKSLFRRLVLMMDNFLLKAAGNDTFNQKLSIKITPSFLGKEALSEKAIPFYYNVNTGVEPLYLSWNRKRTETNTATHILSYKSSDYNTTDDFVMNPLKYDLEPNNFLRIEGHIGQDYRTVLSNLTTLKRSNRLPFDVVALSSDTRGIFSITDAITTMDTTGSIAAAFEEMIKHPCCFSDIFLALDEWINKVRCCLAEQMRYYMALPSFENNLAPINEKNFTGNTFRTDANFVVADNTIGHSYQVKKEAGTINNQFCSEVFVNIATGNAQPGAALVMMPYRIDRMTEILPEHITQLDAKQLELRYADLTGTSVQMRNLYASPNVAGTMVGVDVNQLRTKLEMNCLICLFLELRLLVREFLIRLLGLMIKQKLGYYAYTNPGIQHKAGVPMGGTFILVYHEQQSERKQTNTGTDFSSSLKNVNTKSGTSASSFFSGDQPLLSSILLLDEILFLQQVNAITEGPNEVLDPIVQSIKPGIVIADFYLPYLCCSDCPPTQMVVLPAPETPNQPPVAKPGENLSIELPTNSVTLDGSSSSDPDGTIQTYLWEQQSGPATANIQTPNTPATLISNLIVGAYIFKLTVTDNDGAANSDTVTITVTEKPNIPPKAAASTDKPIVSLPDNIARLIGNNSIDPDGSIVSFVWSLPAGTSGAVIQTPNAASANVQFSQPGVYIFTLTVTDDRGASDSADVTIFVNEAVNQPPVAKAAANPNTVTLSANNTASSVLDSNGSVDPDGNIVSFVWSLPSGTTGAQIQSQNAPVTNVTFTQPGTYIFTLTVKDNKGATANASTFVTVNKEIIIQKSCAPLSDIIGQFNGLPNIDSAQNFKAFTAAYKDFREIQAFYKEIQDKGIATLPVKDQIDFFGSKGIDKLLTKWIKDLQEIIQGNFDLRLLALTMLNIHAQLAYYIACIQSEDVDKAKAPMQQPLEALIGVLEAIIPNIPNFSPAQRNVLKQLLSLTIAERDRVINNGEQTSKPLYMEMLKKIITILNSMHL